MKKSFKKIITIFVLSFPLFLTSCEDEADFEKRRSAFVENVENKESEIALSYNEGDKLIQKLSDGTVIQWITSGSVSDYFTKDKATGAYTCTGADTEGGRDIKITARFIKKDEKAITYDREYIITILDNKIRNTENGIPDSVLYKLMTQIADDNGDGKISFEEALSLSGEVVIKSDREGIVAGSEIKTTKGLHHFPNITSIRFEDLKITNLIVDSMTNLQTLYVDSSYSTVITNMSISNMEQLELVDLSQEVSVTKFEVGSNINLSELNLANKSLRDFNISGENVTIYKLNLSGNDKLVLLNDLSKINKLEELRLSKSGLTDEGAKSIPTLSYLKTLDLSQNSSISTFSFVTPQRFPLLESLNLKSNALSELTLDGFEYLSTLDLEQVRPEDNSRIRSISLLNLPSFRSFNRSSEIKITNLELVNLPSLLSLDLSSAENNEMERLLVESCGIKSFECSSLYIEKAIFKSLYNLESLVLTNIIRDDVTLEDMTSLKSLKLDNAVLKSDLGFLNGAINLEYISLSHVGLKEKMCEALNEMPRLQTLDISSNDSIKDYSFLSKFESLEILHLAKNEIDDEIIKTIPMMSNLRELYLEYNSGIKNLTLDGYQKLEKLDITSSLYNGTQWKLDTLTLKGLKSFKSLVRTATTKISIVTLEELPSLKALNLANASLNSLVIKNVPGLIDLDVSGNSSDQVIEF